MLTRFGMISVPHTIDIGSFIAGIVIGVCVGAMLGALAVSYWGK